MPLFSWVGKTVGPQVVDLSVDILSILLCRGSQIKLDHQQMREEHQAESDLFMDEESLMTEVSSNDKVGVMFQALEPRLGTVESRWLLCTGSVAGNPRGAAGEGRTGALALPSSGISGNTARTGKEPGAMGAALSEAVSQPRSSSGVPSEDTPGLFFF